MTSGPDHYQAAERLLRVAERGDTLRAEHQMNLTALAQVHATLALAAATVEKETFEATYRDGSGRVESRVVCSISTQWSDVLKEDS